MVAEKEHPTKPTYTWWRNLTVTECHEYTHFYSPVAIAVVVELFCTCMNPTSNHTLAGHKNFFFSESTSPGPKKSGTAPWTKFIFLKSRQGPTNLPYLGFTYTSMLSISPDWSYLPPRSKGLGWEDSSTLMTWLLYYNHKNKSIEYWTVLHIHSSLCTCPFNPSSAFRMASGTPFLRIWKIFCKFSGVSLNFSAPWLFF